MQGWISTWNYPWCLAYGWLETLASINKHHLRKHGQVDTKHQPYDTLCGQERGLRDDEMEIRCEVGRRNICNNRILDIKIFIMHCISFQWIWQTNPQLSNVYNWGMMKEEGRNINKKSSYLTLIIILHLFFPPYQTPGLTIKLSVHTLSQLNNTISHTHHLSL